MLHEGTLGEEQDRARRGLRPRRCYVACLWGCFDCDEDSPYCRLCPWKKWRVGEWFPGKGELKKEETGREG
jgi:hypothetical protein